MALRSIPVADFLEIVQFWVGRDWPLNEERMDAAAGQLGWSKVKKGIYETNLPLNRRVVIASESNSADGVDSISWTVTDLQLESSVKRDSFMDDAYVSYLQGLKTLWGKGKSVRGGKNARTRWDLEGGCRVEVVNAKNSVDVSLYSPLMANVFRNLENMRNKGLVTDL